MWIFSRLGVIRMRLLFVMDKNFLVQQYIAPICFSPINRIDDRGTEGVDAIAHVDLVWFRGGGEAACCHSSARPACVFFVLPAPAHDGVAASLA